MHRERVVSRYFDTARPRVFAHRGFALADPARPIPTNTLDAFAAALDAGATHLETDVRATRDGVPVLFHDEHVALNPSADVEGAGRSSIAAESDAPPPPTVPLRSLTWAEVAAIDLGGGHRIPSLADALDAFPSARWNIDLKAPDGVVRATRVVYDAAAADRVLLTSFSERSRARAVRLLPGVATSASSLSTALLLAAALTRRAGVVRAVVGMLPGHVRALQIPERAAGLTLVTAAVLETLHDAGLEVHVWTVNERRDIRRLLTLGVDGIVTDRADVARAVVDVLDAFEVLDERHDTGS